MSFRKYAAVGTVGYTLDIRTADVEPEGMALGTGRRHSTDILCLPVRRKMA